MSKHIITDNNGGKWKVDNVLDTICKEKKHKLKLAEKFFHPVEKLKEFIYEFEKKKLFYNFKEKITNNIIDNKFSIIAEIKQRSPSAGMIVNPSKYNPVDIAKIYENNKATCLSVLTEETFFNGYEIQIANIKNKKIKLPILCKDFFLTNRQVYSARSNGADAILIILAALSDRGADFLYELALKLNMSVIVEVHTVDEAKKALRFKESLIGINNRNLKTLETNINTTYEINNALVNHAGPLISESGIKTKEELLEINKKTKIKTFLIGESLLKDLEKNSIFSVL